MASNQNGGAAGAGESAGAGAGSAAAGSAAAAAAPGNDGAGAGNGQQNSAGSEERRSRGETAGDRAMARVEARAKAGAGAGKTSSSPAGDGSAAVSPAKRTGDAGAAEGNNGASTHSTAVAKSNDGKTTGADGEKPSGSTVDAPADWPQADRDLFAKLPAEGRTLLLDQYKRMQGGLTRANQELARQREQLGTLGEALGKHRVEPARAVELLELSAAFEQNPEAVIQQLAQQKGLKVHIGDLPAAEDDGELPEFKSTKDLAAHIEKRTLARITAAQRADQAKRQREADAKAAQDAQTARITELREQFSAAERDLPDFAQHKAAVVEHLRAAPMLSVANAYRLATYDALVARANKVPTLESELAKVRTEVEDARKAATAPPRGSLPDGKAKTNGKGDHTSPGERAFARAERRRSAAN